jgi:hypothetical protein
MKSLTMNREVRQKEVHSHEAEKQARDGQKQPNEPPPIADGTNKADPARNQKRMTGQEDRAGNTNPSKRGNTKRIEAALKHDRLVQP